MKNITLPQFLEANFLGNVQQSPNKKATAFLSSKAHIEKNEYHHSVYVRTKGKTKKLRTLGKNTGFIFLHEDTLLLDLQRVKKEEKALKENAEKSFYYLNIHTNELTKAFTLPFRASIEKRINDHLILCSSLMSEEEHILLTKKDKERKEYLKNEKKDSLYEDIKELPYYFNGQGFTVNKAKQLFIYDINNQSIKRIFDVDFSVEDFILSNDKSKLYYTGKTREGVRTFTSKIYQYNILEDTHHVLYDDTDYSISMMKEISGQLIVAASRMTDFGLNQNPDFYLVTNNTLRLLANFGHSIGNSIGTDMRLLGSEQSFVTNNTLYFVSTLDEHSSVFTLSLDGHVKKVYDMKGAIDALFMMDDDIYIIGMVDQKLQELYQVNKKFTSLKMLSRLNTNVLSNCYVAKPKKLVAEKNHHSLDGYVLLPKDYDEQKSYPAILDIHGGPKTVYGQIYYHEMQYWANKGYIVFYTNPRGSDGRGNVFADIRGKYGTIDYDDLMMFTDAVLEKYKSIDQSKLFVTGGSYGGFMTNWIVGHTDRFKAAVTQRSISNWISFYGTSDIGFFFASDQTAGHPIKDMDKLYEQSPIKYALNIKTPLRFIHSDKDLRCPMEQAQQLYAILKTNHVDTDLIWFKEETHELSRGGKPQARIKRLKDITDWFEKYRV